jgi:uncharacterized RDD family membrane protein YckC
VHCSSCGAATADGSAFCGSCGRPIIGYSVAQASAAAPAVGAAPEVAAAATRTYAGFWLRFVAYVIDGLIVGAAVIVVAAIAIGFLGTEGIREALDETGRGMNQPNPVFPWGLFAAILVLATVSVLAQWLYFAGMESSKSQGTLGKMALGLVVTDMNGQPISFARASGRFFSKLITGLVPFAIGYIMAGFTEKKQALHDMIASCLVLRKA